MINLLPPQEKQKIIWEKKIKMASIIGILSIFCLLVLWLSFLALQININFQREAERFLAEAEEIKISQINQVKKKIQTINRTLENINKIYKDQVFASEILIKLSSLLPEDAYLENFIFEKKEANQISLIGKVRTLASLNQLREDLRKDPAFSNVQFSISSYVPLKEIEFKAKFIYQK
jgi:Tfp pilus assembly protein PilN